MESDGVTMSQAEVGGENVAIDGYDAVAYFSDGEAVAGSDEFAHDHGGQRWRFSSTAHRDQFAADPERFMLRFDGQ